MNNINNDEYVYIVFSHTRALVHYDDDRINLEIIFKTEEKANDYITGKNKENKKNKINYISYKYEKIKLGEFCYLNIDSFFN